MLADEMKELEILGRKKLSGLLNRVLTQEYRPELPKYPERILVIRTDSRLGNLVLMEPLLRCLSERFPRSRVKVLVSHVYAELLSCQGYDLLVADKKGQLRNPLDFARLVGKMRGFQPDVAIDAAHPHSFSLSGAVTAALSGAPCRISTDAGKGSSEWFTHLVPESPMDWHESRALHTLGSLWDKWPGWTAPMLKTAHDSRRNAVGLHVGASGGKRYPEGKMDRLVDILSKKTLLELYWGTDDERVLAEDLCARYPSRIQPEMSLQRLLERISGLRVFVTADNGPMHVASALSIPVLAIFRVDNQERFRPLSQGSRVMYSPDGPDPDEVADRALEILSYF